MFQTCSIAENNQVSRVAGGALAAGEVSLLLIHDVRTEDLGDGADADCDHVGLSAEGPNA